MGSPSRYVVGIDLGTTNTAVAYIDTQDILDDVFPPIQVFDILQLTVEGESAAHSTLPSFLYFSSDAERDSGRLNLPWDEHPQSITGIFARDQGALTPGRWVSSAKSWLCHGDVDRTAKILPWGSEAETQTCSPVEASSRYLRHIREAWNHAFAAKGSDRETSRFEHQDIVLTVPASFDAEARELTVQAAHDAGIEQLTLLEEPQAAFYAWSAAHRNTLTRDLSDGDLVLVCDVGGGTTDLSLIRVRITDQTIDFERIAIGEHVLLGGDNVDLALAHRLEAKLGNPHLTLRQRQSLRRQSCDAKERLLSHRERDQVSLSLLGSGSSLVGGTLNTELTRDDVIDTLLTGFLPLTKRAERPSREPRTGLRELGLPYANEPAITKHLAQFLADNANADNPDKSALMARPDAVLFNGGFFTPDLTRKRIIETIGSWFRPNNRRWKPKLLRNATPETAVAVGAAYYGQVRRIGGLRIGGGSARAYYIGVQTDTSTAENQVPAVCIMPRGTEEGTTLELSEQVFEVLTNQPVSFTLYSSTTRHDDHGSVVELATDDVRHHAPLITVLRYGKRSRQIKLAVKLTTHVSEVGTLELWCESQSTEHRWRLQFQLRGSKSQEPTQTVESETTQTLISDEAMKSAEQLIRAVFGDVKDQRQGETVTPEALIGQLETLFGYGREAWPLAAIRTLSDLLLEVADGRKKNKQFEARWLNLYGFCLRPGFSATLDDWRIEQARKIYLGGLIYPNHLDCHIQWLVFLRRIVGGMTTGQQNELYQRHLSLVGLSGKKRAKKQNNQLEVESWRLLASLERVAAPKRVALGQALIAKFKQQPINKSYLWSLGRLGARTPFVGPLNSVVPASTAATWLQTLLDLPDVTPDIADIIVQLGARTDDPDRDISPDVRQEALTRLEQAGITEARLQRLRDYTPAEHADAARLFGESLPAGLRLVTPAE